MFDSFKLVFNLNNLNRELYEHCMNNEIIEIEWNELYEYRTEMRTDLYIIK